MNRNFLLLTLLLFTIPLSAQFELQFSALPPSCEGGSNGFILVTPNGGTPPYTYLWSTGGNTPQLQNIPAGNYQVTVSDANQQAVFGSYNLVDNPLLELEIQANSFCDGNADLQAIVSGGSAPYWFQWSNGTIGDTVQNVLPGNYCVTLTDDNLCSISECITIPNALQVLIVKQDISCWDICDGYIAAVPMGGTAPYTYEWNEGATDSLIQYLHPGEYTVTVTDFLGCSVVGTDTVTVPDELVVSISAPMLPCGAGNIGEATATISGGTPPYSFQWSDGQTGLTAVGLTPGVEYFISVFDANFCLTTGYVTILTESEISVNVFTTDDVCGSNSGGAAFAMATAGTPPYTYAWSNGGSEISIMDLAAGDYTVTVTDVNGCVGIASGTVEEAPADIDLFFSYEYASSCMELDGSITVVAVGGQPPYTYLWDTGETSPTISGINSGIYFVTVTDSNNCPAPGVGQLENLNGLEINFNVTGTCEGDNILEVSAPSGMPPLTYLWSTGDTSMAITNLLAGEYLVTVEDASGCVGMDTIQLDLSPSPEIVLSGNNPACFDVSDGWVLLEQVGDSTGLSYIWNTGDTTELIENLSAGTYYVTATDPTTTCFAVDSFSLQAPDSLYVLISGTEPDCFGGSNGTISAEVFGGTAPYTLVWNGNPADTGTVLMDVPAGEYIAVVTDANGCSLEADAFILGQPTALSLDFVIDAPLCVAGENGSITANVSGGTPPYTYLWNTGDAADAIDGLMAGNYSLTVTDNNGCQITDAIILPDGLSPVVQITGVSPACFEGEDGSLSAEATGGQSPYEYEWSNGVSGPENPNIGAGVYMVTVTDANACTTSDSFELTDPPTLVLETEVLVQPCEGFPGGEAIVSVSGGTPDYSYLWSTGDNMPQISDLEAGVYYVTVTDVNGCTAIDSVEIIALPGLTLDLTADVPTCLGGSTGQATVTATGGSGNLSYLWSSGETTATAVTLPAGTATVTVSDTNGCEGTGSIEIEEAADPFDCLAFVVSPISSVNGMDGSVGVDDLNGQAGPFEYLWSTGETTQIITDLGPGIYEVTLTDVATGCLSVCSVELINPVKIGDYVWEDLNQNGQQNGNESGVQGVTVTLTGVDSNGDNVQLSTTTNASGYYLFDGLLPGVYSLQFTNLPLDYEFTVPSTGNPDTDSDVIFANGSTAMYMLVSGDCRLDIDAGIFVECVNVTDPGEIVGNEYLCGPGNDAGPITELTPPSGGVGTIEFLWMMSTADGPFDPSIWIPIPNSNTPNYDPGIIYQTTYYARCVRRDGCTGFEETDIVVKEVGTEAVAQINDLGLICVDDDVLLQAFNNGPGATYQWDFGNDAIPATSNSISELVTWTSFGLKTIHLVVVNNGCTSQLSLDIYVTNSTLFCGDQVADSPIGTTFPMGGGIQEDPEQRTLSLQIMNAMQLLPNPASGTTYLKRSLTDNIWNVRVMDVVGKEVYQTNWEADQTTLSLDLAGWTPGLYFIRVEDNFGQTKVLRLISQ
ncbi:MAG: T9SS type A sorting domain-containing protein [Saprospiraceae bacterium]|nr:T9SS type A sorting domain-containing protein [Saprospiraceae bacterium]